MPTKAEIADGGLDSVNTTLTEHFPSWTDDLPVCPYSGVGFSTNQVYRVDGVRKEEHEFEDRSFHFRLDEDTFFYGVFDGHSGCKAVEFASQRMPAEVLLDQLKDKNSDQEIKDVLQQAFSTVETTFFRSIDDLLAEKENLQIQLQGVRTYEAVKQYPAVVQKLTYITSEIESETTAVVALIRKNKLYVANVGNSRAVLCKADETGNIKVLQLSVDHDFENEDELLRLSQLGVNVELLSESGKTKYRQSTRCIGNFAVKGGYKEFENFSEATEEPIIAEPEIIGGIELDESCKFLLLMSDGLCKSIEQSSGTEDPNGMVVEILLEQFAEQSTLNGVAQAAVDRAVRIHHDVFMKADDDASKRCLKRDDITLLVRNFNQPLPNANRVPLDGYQTLLGRQGITIPKKTYVSESKECSNLNTLSDAPSLDNDSENIDVQPSDSNDFVSSSSESGGYQTLFQTTNNASLDSDGRIGAYVDFSEFYDLVEEAFKENLVPDDWRRKINN